MLALCHRYVLDDQEAEDIMIRGFLIVFEKIHQFQQTGSFEGWVRRIMVNECLAYIRRNKSLYLEVDISQAEREPQWDWNP